MAMASLLTNTSSMILAPQRLSSSRPKRSRLSSSRPKRSYCTTPTFSFKLPLIHEGTSGFGGNMNASDCFGSNSLLFWNDLNQFKCHGTKTDVADVEEGKRSKEPNNDRGRRRFGNRPYAIVVGASFCVILGLCSLKLPKLIQPSHHMSVPYSDLIRGIQAGNVIRVQFEENTRQIYFNTKSLQDQNTETPQTDLLAGSTETSLQDQNTETQQTDLLAGSTETSLQDQNTETPQTDLLAGSTETSLQDQNTETPQTDLLAGSTKTSLQDQNTETPQTDLLAGSTKTSLQKWHYHTTNVEDNRYEVLSLLKEKGITYGSSRELLSQSMKNYLFIFFQVTPFWIILLLTFYQLNAQHNLKKILKRKPSKKQSVTFDDVKGVGAAKTELLEIILCMKGDNKYMKLGAKLPKGVLLTGPPGTGKTLLARAVAGEADVAFFSISASELVEVFVGRGAARVRELFREARKNSPSIIFIDEIDAVGGQRGSTLNCEHGHTLNQLLTEMDGFEKESNVVVIGATNRPETLDSALMRPGRFSRKVRVDVPDENGRKDIFSLYIKDVPMEDDKEAISKLVALLTNGLVGADLENIARESVLLAARRGGEFVTENDILQAVDRAKMKVYDDVSETKGPTMRDFVQGGSLGFGFSN